MLRGPKTWRGQIGVLDEIVVEEVIVAEVGEDRSFVGGERYGGGVVEKDICKFDVCTVLE